MPKTMKLTSDKPLWKRKARKLYHEKNIGLMHAAADIEEVKSAAQLEAERQERLRALKLMFGAWKGRTDIPNDGLVFQEELRSE